MANINTPEGHANANLPSGNKKVELDKKEQIDEKAALNIRNVARRNSNNKKKKEKSVEADDKTAVNHLQAYIQSNKPIVYGANDSSKVPFILMTDEKGKKYRQELSYNDIKSMRKHFSEDSKIMSDKSLSQHSSDQKFYTKGFRQTNTDISNEDNAYGGGGMHDATTTRNSASQKEGAAYTDSLADPENMDFEKKMAIDRINNNTKLTPEQKKSYIASLMRQ
ncbi:MAG: hypothetical protein H8E74_01995 [Gammaproteobacteria bacterium]|nr:hypothetical protein [Gammaproteobacteria bacterium]